MSAGLPNSWLSLANLPASAFHHACHILSLSLETINTIKVKPKALKWPVNPYTLCPFPSHTTFWPNFKVLFSLVLLLHWPPHWAQKVPANAKALQSCPTLYDPVDRSPPGSSVHGILHARILEWVAIPSSSGLALEFRPRDWTCVSYVSCIDRQVL